eukprot:163870-Hanusia_phi.AAC.5
MLCFACRTIVGTLALEDWPSSSKKTTSVFQGCIQKSIRALFNRCATLINEICLLTTMKVENGDYSGSTGDSSIDPEQSKDSCVSAPVVIL